MIHIFPLNNSLFEKKRVFQRGLLKATGVRVISSDQFPVLMVCIGVGAVFETYIFYYTDIPAMMNLWAWLDRNCRPPFEGD